MLLGLKGEGNGTPLQYSCLENPMDGGAWKASVHGAAKSRARQRDFTFTHWRRKWQPTPVFLPGESHGFSLELYKKKLYNFKSPILIYKKYYMSFSILTHIHVYTYIHILCYMYIYIYAIQLWASLVAQWVKNLPSVH